MNNELKKSQKVFIDTVDTYDRYYRTVVDHNSVTPFEGMNLRILSALVVDASVEYAELLKESIK